jgi:hypothetical protein
MAVKKTGEFAMSENNNANDLVKKLDELGGEVRTQLLLHGLVKIVALTLFALGLFYVMDVLFHFPYIIRLILTFGGIAYGVYWFLDGPLQRYRVRLSTEKVSLMVEKSFPQFRSRVISTLQFSKSIPGSNTSMQLISGMMKQTFSMAKEVPMETIVDKSWQKKNFLSLFLSLGLVVTLVFSQTDMFRIFLKRLVLPVSYPTKTRIVNIEMPEYVVAGEELLIKVTASGVLPKLGTAEVSNLGDTLKTDLVQLDESSEYECHLTGLLQNGDLQLSLGDFVTDKMPLTVVRRPAIGNMSITVTPPVYTGLDAEVSRSGNVNVLAGSIVKIEIVPSKDLQEIKFLNKTTTEEVADFSAGDGKWSIEFTPENSMTYTLSMLDKLGLISKDIPDFRITVKEDRKPVIRVLKPFTMTELAATSSMKLEVKIRDDFQLNTVRILYTISEGEYEQDNEFQQFKVRREYKDIQSRQFTIDEIWSNRGLELTEGNLLKIRIEATDNAPEANVTVSEDILVPIISDSEMRRRLSEEFVNSILPVEDLKLKLHKSNRKTNQLGEQ